MNQLGTRAVVRPVEPSQTAPCAGCGRQIMYSAWKRQRRVICNVYIGGVWSHVEHWMLDCYIEAGQPHGEVL